MNGGNLSFAVSYFYLNSSDAGNGILRLYGVNTMHADGLSAKVASASAGMVLKPQEYCTLYAHVHGPARSV